MPIYEFECLECRARTTALVMSRGRIGEVRCRACGSAAIEKLFSRFATPRSEEARLESLAALSAAGDRDGNDPQSVARLVKRVGREMGEGLGEDVDQAIDEEMSAAGEGVPPEPPEDEGE